MKKKRHYKCSRKLCVLIAIKTISPWMVTYAASDFETFFYYFIIFITINYFDICSAINIHRMMLMMANGHFLLFFLSFFVSLKQRLIKYFNYLIIYDYVNDVYDMRKKLPHRIQRLSNWFEWIHCPNGKW